jgi:hypothetical protein
MARLHAALSSRNRLSRSELTYQSTALAPGVNPKSEGWMARVARSSGRRQHAPFEQALTRGDLDGEQDADQGGLAILLGAFGEGC